MQRRKLAAVAGALSVTAFATTVGLGANFGLFGLTQPNSPAGRLAVTRAGASTPDGVGNASVTPVAPPATKPSTAQPDD